MNDDPRFTPKPIPGREFSDWPIDEEELARSIYEDGKSYSNASFPAMPEIPLSCFAYAQLVNEAAERLSGAGPLWELPKLKSFPFGVMEVRESPYIPKSEIWLVDKFGTVHKIINISNALHDADALSLCIGEMK